MNFKQCKVSQGLDKIMHGWIYWKKVIFKNFLCNRFVNISVKTRGAVVYG